MKAWTKWICNTLFSVTVNNVILLENLIMFPFVVAEDTVLSSTLEMKVIGLHEIFFCLHRRIVVNEFVLFFSRVTEFVRTFASLCHEEIGSVLCNFDGIGGVIDGFVRLTIHQTPSTKRSMEIHSSFVSRTQKGFSPDAIVFRR